MNSDNTLIDNGAPSTAIDLVKYQQTVDRALAWLSDNELETTELDDLCSHYKAPYLYASLGDRIKSRKYLELIVSRYMQPDGDFRTTPTEKGWRHLPASPANRYIYANGWIVVGFQKMGAYGAASKGLEFIRRFQSPQLGGFYSRFDPPIGQIDSRYLDTSTTSSAGLAMLACGQLQEAVRAGEFILRVLAAQPDTERHYFSSWNVDTGLMTEVFGDEDIDAIHGRKQFCLSFDQDAASQLAWLVGKPMMFMAKLYDATGEDRFLQGARVFFDYFGKLCDGKWVNPGSCKIMWACSELYRLTGRKEYATTSIRMLNYFCQQQCDWGGWIHTLRYKSVEDQPLAASLDYAQELCGEIGDTLFNFA